jgi:LytS/YehU family sensor histidine kinase
VKLIAREVDGRLKLKVVDQASSTPDAESDVGLHNAAERIRRLYGVGYGLRRRSEPEGSAVEVELPLLPSLTGVPVKTRSSGLL